MPDAKVQVLSERNDEVAPTADGDATTTMENQRRYGRP
jgi:hypothetical protein